MDTVKVYDMNDFIKVEKAACKLRSFYSFNLVGSRIEFRGYQRRNFRFHSLPNCGGKERISDIIVVELEYIAAFKSITAARDFYLLNYLMICPIAIHYLFLYDIKIINFNVRITILPFSKVIF